VALKPDMVHGTQVQNSDGVSDVVIEQTGLDAGFLPEMTTRRPDLFWLGQTMRQSMAATGTWLGPLRRLREAKRRPEAGPMSDTDSFIDEVNDEVRRDRLYHLLRRYGWIAALVIVLIVGGAAWTEYRKAQDRAEAEALGDAMLAALSTDDVATRADQLALIEAKTPASAAVLRLLTAAEQAEAGDAPAAIATLDALAVDGEVPAIYRQLAQFKSLTLAGADRPVADRRQMLETMAQPGNALRLLASEQLALIDIEQNEPEAAIARYQAILQDAETTTDLQQRALQVIVALGGEPAVLDTATDAVLTDPADNN
tara:strand:+ start:457 stop:1395 length:939 start_codon:yes stop_codon:yes gene_type:complete